MAQHRCELQRVQLAVVGQAGSSLLGSESLAAGVRCYPCRRGLSRSGPGGGIGEFVVAEVVAGRLGFDGGCRRRGRLRCSNRSALQGVVRPYADRASADLTDPDRTGLNRIEMSQRRSTISWGFASWKPSCR